MEPEDAVNAGALSRLVDGGFVEIDALAMRATASGRRRLNTVLAQLLT